MQKQLQLLTLIEDSFPARAKQMPLKATSVQSWRAKIVIVGNRRMS